MRYLLTQKDVERIMEHWLNTPANSYRGSRYGEANNRTLFKTMSTNIADQILAKIKNDIPLFQTLNSDMLQILSVDLDADTKAIYLAVGNATIPLSTIDSSNYQGDTFNANAQ